MLVWRDSAFAAGPINTAAEVKYLQTTSKAGGTHAVLIWSTQVQVRRGGCVQRFWDMQDGICAMDPGT